MSLSIQDLTLVNNPIYRPDEPRHFMVMDPVNTLVTATLNGDSLASSNNVLAVKEVARSVYDTQYYFPKQDVVMDLLVPTQHSTTCPLKGKTQYFDVMIADKLIEKAAWSYNEVFDFDERLTNLKGRIAFDKRLVQVIEHSQSQAL